MKKQKTNRLVIVSNRLPFQLTKIEDRIQLRESDGGLVSALKSYFENQKDGQMPFDSVVWVGSAEFDERVWANFKKNGLPDLPYTVSPIFIEKKIYNRYYNGFCNATLWPLFHYFPSFVEFDSSTFDAYREVNERFAECILENILPGDVIWIHDYQLMLLPGLLRKQCPDAAIGFFLHIPFPSFEIFRLLHRPWKESIIDSLLGADLIGFHTHEYVQYFLKSVQMIRGHDHQFRTILMSDRQIKAEIFPLGIDFSKFHNATQLADVIERKKEIQLSFPEKKIIFSVDRLDYTKGITHRLSGFECFLEEHPEWRGKIIFILVVVPSRQIVSKYNERKKLIEEEIGRINGKYSTLGWQPIIYRYNFLSFHDLVAMYNVADIGLITPLRDGMNLVAKEYMASRNDRGVLILSELAGAANELGEAIQVNPMDRNEVSDAIQQALNMPEEIQGQKIAILQERLKDYTVTHWFSDFLKQLEEIKQIQRMQKTRLLSANTLNEIAEKYTVAQRRLLLLDYDGTLVPFAKKPVSALPDKALINLLANLASDNRNDLTIISGRDSKSLEEWFGYLPINLVSEHGAGVRLKNTDWQYDRDIDQTWKTFIRPMLDAFSHRTPGSFVEDKFHTLVWHYRNVNSDLGFIRSRELLDNLHHLARNANLHIIDGNKVIEIRVSGIDKGVVSKKLVEEGQYDFVLAMGDDKTDEDMFRVLTDKAYTIKIGAGHTVAKYYLANQREVADLLGRLI